MLREETLPFFGFVPKLTRMRGSCSPFNCGQPLIPVEVNFWFVFFSVLHPKFIRCGLVTLDPDHAVARCLHFVKTPEQRLLFSFFTIRQHLVSTVSTFNQSW